MSKYKWQAAFEDAGKADKGTVVSRARARWKDRHPPTGERFIRMLRFIYMRDLTTGDANKLHATTLGALMRWGWVAGLDGRLTVTHAGSIVLDADRRAARRAAR